MRSVRLDEELENRLEEAARASGEPVSEIIREAVRRRCDEMLGGRLDRTGKAFTGLLAARTKAKKPKRRGRR
jgi:Arc/MetJ-type ribon-helix-helix transcriptional regulator